MDTLFKIYYGVRFLSIGDFVVRKSHDCDITFKIIDIREGSDGKYCILKGVNLRIIADSPLDDLMMVDSNNMCEIESVFNENINKCIEKIVMDRGLDKEDNIKKNKRKYSHRIIKNDKDDKNIKNMTFARPGKVLHVDGDSEYLEVCMKVYKQLKINAVGKVIAEKEQPNLIVPLVKEVKPDIVVITGHDGMLKASRDYMDVEGYRNSKYFVDSVTKLRDYEPSYDDLVIFAGACQSCYEAILDSGANYASSPGRVLIHCLDPVFICEKVAYTNVSEIVNIQDVVKNTVTGFKGIGGLQTRGKCREGYPKSSYI